MSPFVQTFDHARSRRAIIAPSSPSLLKPGAIPLLGLLFIAGVPLGKEFASNQAKYSEQLAAEALEKAGQIGLESTWIAAAVIGAIYILAAIALIRQRGQPKEGIWRVWPLPALIASSSLCLLWSSFPLPIFMNLVHLVGVVLVSVAAGRAYSANPAMLLKSIAYVFSLSVTIHTLAVFILPEVAINYDERWAGLTTNPNSLGLIASLTLWSIVTLLFLKIIRPIIGFALLLPAGIALYGSGSITAMISSIVGVGSAAILSQVRQPRFGLLLPIAMTILVGMAWTFWLYIASRDIFSIFGRSSGFSGRSILWQQGLEIASMRPILGWGYDNHASVMLKYPLPYGNFHNGYIDLAVRGGLLGFVLLIGLLLVYFRRALRSAPGNRIIMVSYLLMFLIYNISEAAFVSPRNPGWLLMLVGFFLARQTQPGSAGAISNQRQQLGPRPAN